MIEYCDRAAARSAPNALERRREYELDKQAAFAACSSSLRCRSTHISLAENDRDMPCNRAVIGPLVAALMLCGCGFSLREMFAKQGFDYPVRVSRRLAVARLLSPERECRPAAEKQALLNAGLAEITDARLEELAWRRSFAVSNAPITDFATWATAP